MPVSDTTRIEAHSLGLDDATALRASLTDHAAFDVIFDRHAAPVRRYVASRVGWDDADDVVADTFLVAFSIRRRFTADRGVDALPWLLGIATKRIARARGVETRWLRSQQLAAAEHDRGDSFEDDVIARTGAHESAGVLVQGLRQLPRRERDVLLLRVVGELSYEEIAAALHLPLGTVRSRISRARARIVDYLQEGTQP